jgi:hypothetical protein
MSSVFLGISSSAGFTFPLYKFSLSLVIDTIAVAVVPDTLRCQRGNCASSVVAVTVGGAGGAGGVGGVVEVTICVGSAGLGRESVRLVVAAVSVVRVHSSGLGGVALTTVNLVGMSVLREMVIVGGLLSAVTSEAAKEAATSGTVTGARCVVVVRAGAEALLLAVVTGKGNFHQNRQKEENTDQRVSMYTIC